MFRPILSAILMMLAGSAMAQSTQRALPEISATEKALGWRFLFDGRSPEGWRGYRQTGFPADGWAIEDGALRCTVGKTDLVTVEEFGDFDLLFEWKVPAKGNSGVMYRVTEELDATWKSGPEYQVLDDAGANIPAADYRSAGALYELVAPAAGKQTRPVGEFNSGRIRVRDGLIQHWLNEVLLLECRTGTADWRERVEKSKFKAFPGFGAHARGRIALQDHGNPVWFRNIRIRPLDTVPAGALTLFSGQDLGAWELAPAGVAQRNDVFAVREGVLVCRGEPNCYLRTVKPYSDYVLHLEWRWDPKTSKTGNSGVLLGCTGEDRVWPRCVEAQLQHGQAGDFWNLGDTPIKTDPARTNGKNTRKLVDAERPAGEWNEYEIAVRGGEIHLWINGQFVNHATAAGPLNGPIGLQSEGTEIHFRNIWLLPLK